MLMTTGNEQVARQSAHTPRLDAFCVALSALVFTATVAKALGLPWWTGGDGDGISALAVGISAAAFAFAVVRAMHGIFKDRG